MFKSERKQKLNQSMDFVKRESYEHRIDNIVILFPFNQI